MCWLRIGRKVKRTHTDLASYYFGCLPERIVGQMGISLCGGWVGMPEEATNDGKA